MAEGETNPAGHLRVDALTRKDPRPAHSGGSLTSSDTGVLAAEAFAKLTDVDVFADCAPY